MLKFFKRGSPAAAAVMPTAESAPSRPEPAPFDATSPFHGKTSADVAPLTGVLGLDRAREAVQAIRRSAPRSALYVTAPRTSAHMEAVRALLMAEARELATAAGGAVPAVVVVERFDGSGALDVMRLPVADATALREGVAAAVEMLSATLPAAFDSDSYRVVRIALEEELRSGHDSALDALRRKARTQNIGLLRTSNGYAVVPMHEGRVVQKEVFEALPTSLKADVESKLAQFEAELIEVLRKRAVLQQDHRARVQEHEQDAASLAVDAALVPLRTRFTGTPAVATWLDALRADLVRNALLFMAAHRAAQGVPRAPIEIAEDARLARYRVAVPTRAEAGVEMPETLERAALLGTARATGPGRIVPDAVVPGALTRPGGGLVVVDVRDLMASYGAWPIVKHALRAARAAPVVVDDAGLTRTAALELPVDARLVVVGEPEDYRAWCRLDPDVARQVRLVEAFTTTLARTPAVETALAGHLAGFIRDDKLLPCEGAALHAVLATLTREVDGTPAVATDLEEARALLALASVAAAGAGRTTVTADDVAAGLATQRARQAARGGTP
jgi:hypothetical protein